VERKPVKKVIIVKEDRINEDESIIDNGEVNTASVGGSMAALALLESLKSGKSIEVPALGITLTRKVKSSHKEKSPDLRGSR
jgi:hypothetical protein